MKFHLPIIIAGLLAMNSAYAEDAKVPIKASAKAPDLVADFGRCAGVMAAAEKRIAGTTKKNVGATYRRFYTKAAKMVDKDNDPTDKINKLYKAIMDKQMAKWKLSSLSRPCAVKGATYKKAMAIYRKNGSSGIAAFIMKGIK